MTLYKEIEKTFSALELLFQETALREFLSCKYNNLVLYHFSLGIWIRNNLLQEKDALYHLFLESGIEEKDDMSCLIIQLFYLYLKAKYQK